MTKRILCMLLCVCVAFSLVACNPDTPTPQPATKLDAPTGVEVSDDGLIYWDEVKNATGYVVYINGADYQTDDNNYQADSSEDFECYVVATADGYEQSDPSDTVKFYSSTEPDIPVETITVSVGGGTEVKGLVGATLNLTVSVLGTDNKSVTWSVESGSEYATVDGGVVTVTKEPTENQEVTIKAVSVADSTVYAIRKITIAAKQQLTQAMLDAFSGVKKIGFEGYVLIDLYANDAEGAYYRTYTNVIKTAADGERWYAEYENSTGAKSGLYIRNRDGIACQVGLSLTNDEEYFPVTDNDDVVAWKDAGFYNNLDGLKVSDFEFNSETWRYAYKGSDATFAKRMVASANPYDFVPTCIELILEEGQVAGFYSKARADYGVAEGYRAIQSMFVAIDTGNTVTVPTLEKYSHEGVHDKLTAAIANMQNLSSYKVDFYEETTAYAIRSQKGFEETITDDQCYFQTYTMVSDRFGNANKSFEGSDIYAYKKVNDSLYNHCVKEDGKFDPRRAYAADFSKARPSFQFAAELFRTCVTDENSGTSIYYVDSVMSQVATTWYKGVGTDLPMYGIYAQEGYVGTTYTLPYVIVRDGYIIEAGFYFYMGVMYGGVQITYSDFNTATAPEEVTIESPRQVPNSWSQLTIVESANDGSTVSDVERNAAEYLTTFFGSQQVASQLPFFGNVLGDCYALGRTEMRIPTGQGRSVNTIRLWYDVELDIDGTLNTSLDAIENYLVESGFTKDNNGVFAKGTIRVQPMDSQLDLFIFVWVG